MITKVGPTAIFHSVPTLGRGVAENVVGRLDLYLTNAGLFGLSGLPCFSLEGDGWANSWEELLEQDGFTGAAGEYGDLIADSLILRSPTAQSRKAFEMLPDGESHGVISTLAHETVHLRWLSLLHSPEFSARAYALLAGAVFPPPSGLWSLQTKEIMARTRRRMEDWLAEFLRRSATE
jgi:hypothetical protein